MRNGLKTYTIAMPLLDLLIKALNLFFEWRSRILTVNVEDIYLVQYKRPRFRDGTSKDCTYTFRSLKTCQARDSRLRNSIGS
jgi:hypothetical protein